MKWTNRYIFLSETDRSSLLMLTVCSLPPGDGLAEVQKQYVLLDFSVRCCNVLWPHEEIKIFNSEWYITNFVFSYPSRLRWKKTLKETSRKNIYGSFIQANSNKIYIVLAILYIFLNILNISKKFKWIIV